jgi:hypothetical protein
MKVVFMSHCNRCGSEESNSADASFPTVCRNCGASGTELVPFLYVGVVRAERFERPPTDQITAQEAQSLLNMMKGRPNAYALAAITQKLTKIAEGSDQELENENWPHHLVIGYLKGKAAGKGDELANAPNPTNLETDIDTLKDAAAVLEEEA